MEMLPNYIVDKIISIHIPINDIQDKVVWKFTSDEKFIVKTATWANNDKTIRHPTTR